MVEEEVVVVTVVTMLPIDGNEAFDIASAAPKAARSGGVGGAFRMCWISFWVS